MPGPCFLHYLQPWHGQHVVEAKDSVVCGTWNISSPVTRSSIRNHDLWLWTGHRVGNIEPLVWRDFNTCSGLYTGGISKSPRALLQRIEFNCSKTNGIEHHSWGKTNVFLKFCYFLFTFIQIEFPLLWFIWSFYNFSPEKKKNSVQCPWRPDAMTSDLPFTSPDPILILAMFPLCLFVFISPQF